MRNVVIWLEGFYAFQVKGFQAVWRQVQGDEFREVVEAGFEVGHTEASDTDDLLVVPDVGVQLLEALLAGGLEEVGVLGLLVVLLEDVDRQDDCAGGHLGGSVVQELGLVELELADREAHVKHRPVQVVGQDPQVALHGLDGAGEVEVKAEFDEDIRFEVDESLLGHGLLLLGGQQVDHSGKRRGNRLL